MELNGSKVVIAVPSIFMEASIEIIFHGRPTCCSQEPDKGQTLLA